MKRTVAVAVAILAAGCGTTYSSSPTAFTDAEGYAVAVTESYGDRLGVEVEIVFEDDARPDGEPAHAGIANGPTRGIVWYYRPWVNSVGYGQIDDTARHEVCHIKHGWSEAEAEACQEELR
jgi:hypothetical protein